MCYLAVLGVEDNDAICSCRNDLFAPRKRIWGASMGGKCALRSAADAVVKKEAVDGAVGMSGNYGVAVKTTGSRDDAAFRLVESGGLVCL